MNLFVDESGEFKAGAVLSQQGESYQVEMPSGKRAKVRAKDVLLHFATPSAVQLMEEAQAIAGEIDLNFLWEVAGQEEFGFAELATEYFGHEPKPHEAAGLIMRIHAAPIYFQKKGKGRYKAVPENLLKAALAGIEKKRQQGLVQAQYVEELKAGRLPEAMRGNVLQLLFKPNKNSIEYKAMETASNELQTQPQRLMLAVGGIASAHQLHFSKFLFNTFPKRIGFPSVELPNLPELPLAEVQAFSIDDATTTEIDDAMSVTRLPDGKVRIGIHIAAPGLGIKRGDALDAIARQRLSTVYMPGDKIIMLPDELVEIFTLGEGRACPALSLYATLDPSDWTLISTKTRAERVPIAANLRHNDLDALVTEESLDTGTGDYPYKDDLVLLWQWVQLLEKGRMAKREAFGLRPEQNNRVDFNFYVEDEVVTILRRKRGAPLDKIVAELAIFANSTWGKLLHDHGVPGIYRSQGAGNGSTAKMKVRMVTHAAPHKGLGVDQYAWSTSPLRRYTDLVNQWQILACAEHGVTAPLVAPFKQRDADLFAIVSAFDMAYSSYSAFQSDMERYWCLRWLAQEKGDGPGIQVDAVVLKDEIVRLTDIPLVIRLPGMPQAARGAQIRLDLLRWDEVDLSVEARVLDIQQAESAAAVEELDEEMSDDLLEADTEPVPNDAADASVANGADSVYVAADSDTAVAKE